MKVSELQAYADGAIEGYSKGTDNNPYDPETHSAERHMYQRGYDYGVARYCDEDNYCYNCGYEHADPSAGSYPEKGCADYEETTEGESQ